MNEIIQEIPSWIHALSMLVAAASAIAALTPSTKDDSFLKPIRNFVDFLAFNFLNAKNKDEK